MSAGRGIAAVVMTANEAENIGKCLESLRQVDKVFVLDSASTDGTIAIAEAFANAQVVQTKWRGYAQTFNQGIELAAGYPWVLRIDADEELRGDIRSVVAGIAPDVSGLVVRRPIYFLGQRLRFGPHANLKMLRLFRQAEGRCEATTADEHIIVNGKVQFEARLEIVDNDLKPFDRWLHKHIRWAKKEAANLRLKQTELGKIDAFNQRKRFLKFYVYYALPPILRAFLYFGYRFFFCLECFGGRANIVWCVLQGLWYRLLVDIYTLYPQLIDDE